MGLFNFFGKKENDALEHPKKQIPWLRLTHLEQLDEIIKTSQTLPVVIFKHATSCGISRMVLRNFEHDYRIPDDNIKLYYLDLHAYRTVSDEVAYRFGVMHQSPQLLIIKNGRAVHEASHQAIDASHLLRFV